MSTHLTSESALVGLTLGHYRITEKIGAGGMGEVYRARDEHLDREVAIKVLPPGTLTDDHSRKRFHKEAVALSRLNHPNIATVFDFDTQQGIDFLVMEYIPGVSLNEKLAAGPLPEKEVLRLGVQLAEGLSAAHEQGVVHRDLKPGNLRLTGDARLKILDFGLAKLRHAVAESGATESLTETQATAGTVPYMAPEQLLGGEIDARTDIHAAGAVLYEMATGRRPFAEVERLQLVGAILHKTPPLPSTLHSVVSAELDRIIGKCLEKEPENRYQLARELAVDIRRLQSAALGVQPAPSRSLQRPGEREVPSRAGKLWKVLAPTAIVVLALAAGSYFYFHRAPKLTEKDTIVLADFTNTTGDPVFTDTLRQGLLVQLNQSPFLNILPEDKIQAALRQMGRQPQESLNEHVAREVCQRSQSQVFIAGSIASLGSQYVLGLKAVSCPTGEVLAQQQAQVARKEDVLESLGRQASQFRRKLGESLASVQRFDVPLEQATTSSLEALQQYSLGVKKLGQLDNPSAAALFKRATELDPNFAMAYARLGTTYFNLGKAELSEESIGKAYSLRQRVTDRERLYIEARYHVSRGEVEKADLSLELWKSFYPLDYLPHVYLMMTAEQLGQYDRALEEAREAFRREPARLTLWNLINSYMDLNQTEEATKLLEEPQTRQLTSGQLNFRVFSYELAFLRDDAAGMERIAKSAPSGSAFETTLFAEQASAEAYYGRAKKARALVRRAVESFRRQDRDEVASDALLNLALCEADFGNSSEARRNALEGLSLRRHKDVMVMAALVYARIGELQQARALAEELGRRYPSDTLLNLRELPLTRAALEIQQKNPSRAIELLESARSVELGNLDVVYTRGEAYLLLKRGAEAAGEYQKILDHPGLALYRPMRALARLGVARAHALERATAKARAEYEQFLALWKDADADVPILKQAKSEYAKLK